MSLLEWLKFWSKMRENTPYSEVQNTPPKKWKLSESPNPRVSEYPPMKIVRESNPRVSEYPPQNENCQRVQIREFQNTPQNENCQRVQIREFQNTPQNKSCQRVQIREFQNTPPKLKTLVFFPKSKFHVPQNTPPPKKKIGKTSDFKLQNSLKIREIYVETNL